MEKDIIDYLNFLRIFGRIYIQSIMDSNTEDSDIRPSQVKAVYAFMDNDTYSMKELADNARMKLPNMTIMIDEMESSGLVKRIRDKNDRRKVLVGLTAKGKRFRENLLLNREKFTKEMFIKLNKEDKDELLSSLEKVCRILGKTLPEGSTSEIKPVTK